MSIIKEPFGFTADGTPVSRYLLSNGTVTAAILSYGCTIQSVLVPDRSGRPVDVVLGYDSIQGYEQGSCFLGAFVGRYANRIAGSSFVLDGKTVSLTPNEGRNHLHGTYENQVFDAEISGDSLIFRRVSPDGEDGYPGTVNLTVTYTLTENNELVLDYQAETDAPTVLNLTNHSYFNLAGTGDVLDHELELAASMVTEADSENLTTGRFLFTEGTPLDFLTGKPLGRDLLADHPMLQNCRGYDLNYVLNSPCLDMPSAKLTCPRTGITMTMATTQPGMQLYTGNYVDGDAAPCGKQGVRYPRYGGVCLETQHFPCSPNQPDFPSAVLRPGETYHQITVYRFISENA